MQDELRVLERRISAERFAPYRAATADDPAKAIMLYERNLERSAAFWEVLSELEVLVPMVPFPTSRVAGYPGTWDPPGRA